MSANVTNSAHLPILHSSRRVLIHPGSPLSHGIFGWAYATFLFLSAAQAKYQKSRTEERLDKVVRLADQLGLPRAAVSGGDRPLPSLPPGAASMQVARMPFPEPAADVAFPTPLAAKLAISVQLCRPLGSLPEPDRAFIDALLAETLDRKAVAARVREHFRTAGRG